MSPPTTPPTSAARASPRSTRRRLRPRGAQVPRLVLARALREFSVMLSVPSRRRLEAAREG
jgi:hypothetical protein